MNYQPQPGDVGLSGDRTQKLVSLAIRLGSVLRHERTAGDISLALFICGTVGAIVVAILRDWSLLGAIAATAVGLVVAVALIVIVAAAFGFASKNKDWFSHSFIVHHVDPDGTVWITEAHASGCATVKLHYTPGDFVWLKTSSLLGRDDADEMRAFLDAVTTARWKYDYGTFAGLAVYAVTGAMLAPAGVGTAICSGLTSEALTRGKAIWPLPAYRQMPMDQFWFCLNNGIEIIRTDA